MHATQNDYLDGFLDSLRTFGEVAETLGVSYRHVGRLAERGELEFVQIAGRRLVPDGAVAAYLARHGRRAGD